MYYIINGIKINIKSDVLSDLKKYYYASLKYETGGILLGKFNKENKVIEIAEVYEIKTNFFSRILYRRNAKKAQKIINKRWRQTDGVINYIGEWHTHSVNEPILSITDKRLINQLYKDGTNVFRYFFMIILGNTGNLFIGVVDSKFGGKFRYEKLMKG